MTAIDPITFKWYREINSEGATARIYGSCNYNDALDFLIPVMVFLIVLLIMLRFQAWKARNISTEFSESKQIFKVLVIFDIAIFLGWPILFLSQDSPNVLVLMSASINFLIALSTILLLFIPKLISHKKYGDSGPPLRPMRLTGTSDPESAQTAAAAVTANTYTSSGDGEAILTTKSPKQLLDEIYLLHEELRELKDENARLLQQIPENGQDAAKLLGKDGSTGIRIELSTSAETDE